MARRYINPNRPASADAAWSALAAGAAAAPRLTAADRRELAAQAPYARMVANAVPSTGDAPGRALEGKGLGSPHGFVSAIWHRNLDDSGRRRIRAAMSESVPSDGGFLLPEELRTEVMAGTLGSAIVRPRATVFPVKGYFFGLPQVDDTDHSAGTLPWLTATWTKPGDAIAESTGSFGRIMLEPLNLKSLLSVNNELLADADAFHVWWERVVPGGIGWYEDAAFINGIGAGEPQGILNSGCAIKVTRAAASHVSFADPPAMLARFLPASLERAEWLCSQSALTDMLSLYQTIGTAPTSAAVPPSQWVEFRDGQWTLCGLPLHVTEHVPALGSAGDLVLVDFSFYVIADKQTMQMDTGPHYKFADDITMLRVRHRVNGRCWLNSPLTPENGPDTVSPVVVLN